MRCLVAVVFLLCANGLFAQRVVYSSFLHDYRYGSRQVAGKAGDFYWLEKEKQRFPDRHPDLHAQSFFDVFDTRLNKVSECVGEPLAAGTQKEYFVAGNRAFDQLFIVNDAGKTRFLLKRFSADGNYSYPLRQIDSLPFQENPGSFLLVRSPDRQCMAVIVFESSADRPRRLHTMIFDDDWNLLSRATIHANTINAPCIQDDFASLPAEAYDNIPVKLSDNGEWYMGSTSASSNHNYNLYHFFPNGSYRMREVSLSPDYITQDIALSLDEDGYGAGLAVLSGFHQTTLKKIQTIHYSDRRTTIDFDSSYYFNTNAGSIISKNQIKDYLLPLPTGGYMYFTEYGKQQEVTVPVDPAIWETAYLFAGYNGEDVPLKWSSNPGYAGAQGLSYQPALMAPGDMRMYYFPGRRGDATWSGLIHESQNTGVNWPSLSYMIMPEKNKLLFIYNASMGQSNVASSTAVDLHGAATDEPLVFWTFKKLLNFQRGQRIGPAEIAVPYLEQPGFAIIRAGE